MEKISLTAMFCKHLYRLSPRPASVWLHLYSIMDFWFVVSCFSTFILFSVTLSIIRRQIFQSLSPGFCQVSWVSLVSPALLLPRDESQSKIQLGWHASKGEEMERKMERKRREKERDATQSLFSHSRFPPSSPSIQF